MTGPATVASPLVGAAEVVRVEEVGVYRILWLREPRIAAGIQPGEFLEVRAEPCLLRRPFSVYLADPDAAEVAIAFHAIGPGTRWIAARAPGDVVDVAGPLGRGFTIPDEPGVDLIVGGGYGAAALALLAERLVAGGGAVHAVLGGRSADRVFSDRSLDEVSASVAITTDDGSRGRAGVVTDVIPALVERFSPRTIYACGPNPMLAAVDAQAATLGVRAQLAVEEFMACGIGVCWTCVVPVRTEAGIAHQRVCTEGPVFEGSVIAWA